MWPGTDNLLLPFFAEIQIGSYDSRLDISTNSEKMRYLCIKI